MVPVERNLIIAVDVGTTGLKVGLVRADLQIEVEAIQPYPVNFMDGGRVEQHPSEWWQALGRAMAALSKKVPELRSRAAGLVFSAQMCGVVAVDESGTPLRPCMIWLDKRASGIIRSAMSGFPPLFGYGAFKLLSSIWLTNGAPSLNGMDPPGKMMWLRHHEPDVWAKTHKFLDVKDWLIHRACGRFVTTADSANLTWMMDTRTRHQRWSPYLMKRFGIAPGQLPEIVAGTSSPGGLTKAAAASLGLPEGLPVIAGCGDVCGAAIGSGSVGDGELHISLGTSAWIGGFYPSRRLSASEGYATILCPVENRPLLIATQESAGSCLDWFEQVASAPKRPKPGPPQQEKALPLFLPWLAGERVPVDDNRLRGAFLGLSLMHGQESLAQAVVEGVALNIRWAHQSVARQRGTLTNRRIPLVGGAALNPTLCQALADCLATEFSVGPAPRMAGVQGASAIAASYLGFYANTWQAAESLSRMTNRVYSPTPERARYFDRRFKLFLDAYRQTAPWFRRNFASELTSP